MKKFHFLFLLIAISLFGCHARNGTAPVTYKIAGLGDVTVTKTQSGELNLSVSKITAIATSENLTLSLSGLPAGVTATINPKTGTPPFTASIVISDSNAAGGRYAVKLLVHSSTSGDSYYPFNLTVEGPTDMLCTIAGYFPNSTAACSANGSYDFVETVANDSTIANRIIFRNFASMGYSVYGMLDCATSTITIPAQSLPNFLTVSGGGSFLTDSTTTVWVNYTTVNQAGDSSNCSFTLRH